MPKSSLISFLLLLFITHQLSAQIQDIRKKEKLIMNQYDQIEYNDVGKIANMDDIQKMVNKSREIKFRAGEIRGLVLLQRNALRRDNYSLSEKYGNEAEKLALMENDNYSLGHIQLNKACVAIDLGLYSDAKAILENTTYGDNITNKADKNIYFSNSYMLLAGLYSRMEQKDSMLYYTKKSLDVIERTPVNQLTQYQKVRYYYLEIFQLMNLGIAYAYHPKNPRIDLAEKYFQRALQYSVTHPQYFKLCDIEVYESLGWFYFTKKEYQKSIDFCMKVLELEKVKKKPEHRLGAYEGIKDAYSALGNSAEELKYLKLYTDLSDSIKNAQKITVINQSKNKINTFRDVYNENRLTVIFSAAGVILLIIMASWYYNKKKEREHRKKYDELIHELHQKSLEASDENTGNENNHEELDIKDPMASGLSTETEKKLLKKLEAFENSEKFLKKGINIGYLSNILNTNPKYLSEIIKNNKAQNFNAYINKLRINYIVYKLYNNPKYREYKISYLAEESGYASSQVFVIAFKKEKGVTPSYFINQLSEPVHHH